MKGKYFKINFQKASKALFLLYIVTLLWSSASNFHIKKEPPTSRHFVNKLAHSNSVLSNVQNQMRKTYFRIASRKITFFLYIFCCVGIHPADSRMAAMQISKKYTISPYVFHKIWLHSNLLHSTFIQCSKYIIHLSKISNTISA